MNTEPPKDTATHTHVPNDKAFSKAVEELLGVVSMARLRMASNNLTNNDAVACAAACAALGKIYKNHK